MSLFLDAFASAMSGCDGLSALLLALTTALNPESFAGWELGLRGGSCQNIWPESECFSLSGQNWGLLIFLSSSGIFQPLTFKLKAFYSYY